MRTGRATGTVWRHGPPRAASPGGHSVRKPLLALAPLLSTLAFAAPSALAAQRPCASATTATTFSAWGDDALYTPFQGGDFEHGASGWSWGGKASIVSGDSDGALSAGSHAVELPAGGLAKSPWLCVDETRPSM